MVTRRLPSTVYDDSLSDFLAALAFTARPADDRIDLVTWLVILSPNSDR